MGSHQWIVPISATEAPTQSTVMLKKEMHAAYTENDQV